MGDSLCFFCSVSSRLYLGITTPALFGNAGAFCAMNDNMATVEKDINETSEKIDEVKRIVQERALALEYKKQIP